MHTTGESEYKGSSCLASQIEVAEQLTLTRDKKKADLQFPAPFGNNKLFKMSLDV